MSAARIIIVTPAPTGSRAGNRNTAVRWARILRGLGCRVCIRMQWNGADCDLLVVLHAKKSHGSLKAFRKLHPDKPAVLALTGTDLYRDIRENAEAKESLKLATRLVVLQRAALDELTTGQRAKAHVIHQSVAMRAKHRPPRKLFRIAVLGHLREEKDPFRAAYALQRLSEAPSVEVVQAGKALSAGMARTAARLMRSEPRYRWVGELPHWQALRLLCRSTVMVISSFMEGGAHVVSEAIALGVPVIASDIPGNRGLLGGDYPAYFRTGDDAALAALVRRMADDAGFLRRVESAVARRRGLVSPATETEAWHRLLAGLGLSPYSRSSSRTGAKLRR